MKNYSISFWLFSNRFMPKCSILLLVIFKFNIKWNMHREVVHLCCIQWKKTRLYFRSLTFWNNSMNSTFFSSLNNPQNPERIHIPTVLMNAIIVIKIIEYQKKRINLNVNTIRHILYITYNTLNGNQNNFGLLSDALDILLEWLVGVFEIFHCIKWFFFRKLFHQKGSFKWETAIQQNQDGNIQGMHLIKPRLIRLK